VIAQPPIGHDATAAKTLKVDVPFPNDDTELAAFMKGLDTGMKTYSAALTKRSFGRDQQQGLLDSYASFVKLQREVKAQKSARTVVSGDRASSFAMLRSYTKSYRRVGMTFFHGQASEKDFKRLAKQRKPSPAAAAKAAERKQARKARAAAKKAKAAAKRAARKPARDAGSGGKAPASTVG
jgi:hypothetical protein